MPAPYGTVTHCVTGADSRPVEVTTRLTVRQFSPLTAVVVRLLRRIVSATTAFFTTIRCNHHENREGTSGSLSRRRAAAPPGRGNRR